MYCLFCVVLCIVCVYMCTVLLPPGDYPIAVKYIISYIISYHIISKLNVCEICLFVLRVLVSLTNGQFTQTTGNFLNEAYLEWVSEWLSEWVAAPQEKLFNLESVYTNLIYDICALLNIMQCMVVIPYRRFGATDQSHLQGSRSRRSLK
jgi:hypothetical protein